MDAKVMETLLKWRVLTKVNGRVIVRSPRIEGISYQELVEVVETILKLEDSRAAAVLLPCFVCAEWTEQYLDEVTKTQVTEEMDVYALLPREQAHLFVQLASKSPIADRRKLRAASEYFGRVSR